MGLVTLHCPCDVVSCNPVLPRPRFICKNNGVLFENDILQIGIKSEYRLNLGRVGIFFGNKTPIALMVRTAGNRPGTRETVEGVNARGLLDDVKRNDVAGGGGCNEC